MPGEVLAVLHENLPEINPALIENLPLNPIQVVECRWGTIYRLNITDGTPVEEMVDILKADSRVRIAEPNFIYYFLEEPYFPNDPMWAYADDPETPRDSAYDQWGPAMAGASVLWNDSNGSEDVVVAVMDTGIRLDHEDLHDNLWFNEGETLINGIDDDHNGYIDDWWGWNTVQNNNDPYDDGSYASYHGTACAGIVAAVQDNERGVSGIAPGVKIMAIKVDLSGYGGFVTSVVAGMNYVMANDVDIVSMSFRSYDYSEIMENACNDAWDNGHGAILMGGIGNESTTELCYPNAYDSVMAIGGSCPFTEYLQRRDEKRIASGQDGYYWGSNYGNHMNVMGYGAQYTTTYGGHYSGYWDGYGSPGFFGGTSCATPMAAGVMALIRSYYPEAGGDWCWERIEQTADDLHSPGFDIQSGHGRVNALRAVFGSDRFTDLEDENGFVSLTLPEDSLYDTIHDVPGNPLQDIEDLYRLTMDVNGYLIIDLDIFTWGEDLDIELFTDPEMTNLAASSTGPNHFDSSFENIEFTSGIMGQDYFIRVYSPASGNSTTYGITVKSISNELTVTGESLAPMFIQQEADDVPFLKLIFDIGIGATLDRLNISKIGSMPSANIDAIYLYRDSNDDGVYDPTDQLMAQTGYAGTNRFVLDGLNINWMEELVLFVTADLAYTPDFETIRLSLESYKDVVTDEGVVAHYSHFPITSDELLIGTDTDPPEWDSTAGAQIAEAGFSSAIIGFNQAIDQLTPPVKYNVYYSDLYPFDISGAEAVYDVVAVPGTVTDLQTKIYGLEGDIEWFFVVRTEDQVGNEDENLSIASCIPFPGGDPSDPQILLTIPGQTTDVAFNGNLLVTTNGWSGIKVFDRTDPANPVQIGTWDDGDNYKNLSFDGTFAYITGQNNLTVVDCSIPSSPQTVDTFDIGPDHGILYGSSLYVDRTFPPVFLIFDISNPYSIPIPSAISLPIGFANQMDVNDSLLYLCHSDSGVMVYDLVDPSMPYYLNSFGPVDLETIAIFTDTLCTVNLAGDISTFDLGISTIDPPLLDTNADSPSSFSKEIVIVNAHAYVSESNYGIYVYDISDPYDIQLVGDLELYNANGLSSDGALIYAAASNGLNIIM